MLEELVKQGQDVLLLWASAHPPNNIEHTVEGLRNKVGKQGRVQVEHVERLSLSGHSPSSFDLALSGILAPSTYIHSAGVLAQLAKILKPNGVLLVREPAGGRSAEKLLSALRLSGYVKLSESKVSQLSGESIQMVEVSCHKPEFEVGASKRLPLSFAKKNANPVVNPDIAQVWTFSAKDINDDDVDLIDSDTLLEDDDLKRPEPASLKSGCGTGKPGKRKACKNCSCGLAEDLEEGKEIVKREAKSACGSCYLGDAFRCASCPYLGMPAFKHGEQILLSKRQLNPDV